VKTYETSVSFYRTLSHHIAAVRFSGDAVNNLN
jgi:hypothetical protein